MLLLTTALLLQLSQTGNGFTIGKYSQRSLRLASFAAESSSTARSASESSSRLAEAEESVAKLIADASIMDEDGDSEGVKAATEAFVSKELAQRDAAAELDMPRELAPEAEAAVSVKDLKDFRTMAAEERKAADDESKQKQKSRAARQTQGSKLDDAMAAAGKRFVELKEAKSTGAAPPPSSSPDWSGARSPKPLGRKAALPAPRKSIALPFTMAPAALDGSLAGDVGFDPFYYADSRENLLAYRDAEVKHARLAMLAAAGWPLAELYHPGLARALGTGSFLNADGRNPAVLNGFPGALSVGFVAVAFALVGAVELATLGKQYASARQGDTFAERSVAVAKLDDAATVCGGYGFDPLNLYNLRGVGADGKRAMETAELKNGRLAMLAITGMAIQEAILKTPVVEQTPFFFYPFGKLPEKATDYVDVDAPAPLLTVEGALDPVVKGYGFTEEYQFGTAPPPTAAAAVEDMVDTAAALGEGTAIDSADVAGAVDSLASSLEPIKETLSDAIPAIGDLANTAAAAAAAFPDFGGL